MNINEKCVNAIRMLSIDEIQEANSGHPGLPLGASPMAYVLWKNMKHNPKKPNWFNRDRFVLSAGHGSSMLYALLYLFGYGLEIDDLKNFRKLYSKTPGHPEYEHTIGVECTTGPLGQGISTAVGMAMAEKHLAALYNKDIEIINHHTYVLCGDGDLMEGISNEASSIAGTLGLSKLIVLYDSNKITIEGSTDLSFKENVMERYDSLGWQTLEVKNGNDLIEIKNAIDKAKEDDNRPTLIKVDTIIGYGSPKQNTAKVHGEPLGLEGVNETKKFYNYAEKKFFVEDDVKESFKLIEDNLVNEYLKEKNIEVEYKEKYPKEYEKLIKSFNNEFDLSFLNDKDLCEFNKDMATRASSSKILNKIAEKFDLLFGGSADLGPSNKTVMENSGIFSENTPKENNISFGIREHAMAAIINGITLHGGLKSYGATFLVFSDYLKGSLRLSCLQKLPVIYIFTHDSIGVGEDGPTHQPIEQLAMLRSTPNNVVFRPADSIETAIGWKLAMESKNHPTCLILSRQTLPNLKGSNKEALKGAYIVKKEEDELSKIIIATGSEVHLAVEAAEIYGDKSIRVVSMPSMELFELQEDEYKEKILPNNIKNRIVIEAASSFGWHKYSGDKGQIISIDSFGMSGPGKEVFEYFNISVENIIDKLKKFDNFN